MKVTNKDYARAQKYLKPKVVIKLFSIGVGIKYLGISTPFPYFLWLWYIQKNICVYQVSKY